MTVNSSKVYGPKGSALLYKREGIMIAPVTYGGGQERELRSGTEAVPLHYSFGSALQEAVDMRDTESARLRALRDEAVELLRKEIPSIIFYGAFEGKSKEQRVTNKEVSKTTNPPHSSFLTPHSTLRLPNNINCRVPGISSEEMILRLDAKGFSVSHKSACASMETEGSYVVMALGATEEEAQENIRISMGRSTTKHDLQLLVEAMKEIVEKYKK
jgi:cysteine desulfurase